MPFYIYIFSHVFAKRRTKIFVSTLVTTCITASGSIFHQLLAASRKRRKSPKLLKGLEPPANQVSNKGAPLPRDGPSLMVLRRLPRLQEGMEKQAQASSPADVAGGDLAILQKEMLEQPPGWTPRKSRVDVRGMGDTG
jgi:hypothetical protein